MGGGYDAGGCGVDGCVGGGSGLFDCLCDGAFCIFADCWPSARSMAMYECFLSVIEMLRWSAYLPFLEGDASGELGAEGGVEDLPPCIGARGLFLVADADGTFCMAEDFTPPVSIFGRLFIGIFVLAIVVLRCGRRRS